jgi:hypothetical protein
MYVGHIVGRVTCVLQLLLPVGTKCHFSEAYELRGLYKDSVQIFPTEHPDIQIAVLWW